MKWFNLLALAGFGATIACGAGDSVAPTEDFADAWVGAYSGVGSYTLSNGDNGVEQPTTMLIESINAKQISIAAKLVYDGDKEVTVLVLLTPEDAERINAEYRSLSTRTVFALAKDDGVIGGSIVTSSLRIGGTWTQDQSMIIEVNKQ